MSDMLIPILLGAIATFVLHRWFIWHVCWVILVSISLFLYLLTMPLHFGPAILGVVIADSTAVALGGFLIGITLSSIFNTLLENKQ